MFGVNGSGAVHEASRSYGASFWIVTKWRNEGVEKFGWALKRNTIQNHSGSTINDIKAVFDEARFIIAGGAQISQKVSTRVFKFLLEQLRRNRRRASVNGEGRNDVNEK